jgi:hypothetical protein
VIDQEILTLTQATKKLKQFVDTQVAHSAKAGPSTLPTFQDVDDAIDVLEKLLRRYMWLFRSTALTTALPTWQFDWTEIFRYPWLPPPPNPPSTP